MKILFGIIIGAALFMSGTAFAASPTGMKFISSVWSTNFTSSVDKYYDYDAGVICYVAPRSGIACIKSSPSVPGGS